MLFNLSRACCCCAGSVNWNGAQASRSTRSATRYAAARRTESLVCALSHVCSALATAGVEGRLPAGLVPRLPHDVEYGGRRVGGKARQLDPFIDQQNLPLVVL